jgi:hypothetical protein
MKGNATFDAEFSQTFHLPVNQEYQRDVCNDLKKHEGISPRFDNEKRDQTVNCWTDLFINQYLAPKLLASELMADKIAL